MADRLVIKAQVQVIKDRPQRPFKCLDGQYRRELLRVYLANVEGIARRYVEEQREVLQRLLEPSKGFSQFWRGLPPSEQQRLASAPAATVLKVWIAVIVSVCVRERKTMCRALEPEAAYWWLRPGWQPCLPGLAACTPACFVGGCLQLYRAARAAP
jgi:hypothetical protein